MLVKGTEKSETIYAEKKENSFIKLLLNCFNRSRSDQQLSNVIQLSIKYSNNKFERIVEIKGDSGVYNL
jgi:hypothetical protein